MPTVNLVGRITRLGNTIGYMVIDVDGQQKPIPKDDILCMAQQNMVFNATLVKGITGYSLKGRNGYNLKELPIIKINSENKNKFSAEAKDRSTVRQVEVYEGVVNAYRVAIRDKNSDLIYQPFKNILEQGGSLEFQASSGNMKLPVYVLDIKSILESQNLADGVSLRIKNDSKRILKVIPADYVPSHTGDVIPMCCAAVASFGDRGAVAYCRCIIGRKTGQIGYMWANRFLSREEAARGKEVGASERKQISLEIAEDIANPVETRKDLSTGLSDRAKQLIEELKNSPKMDMSETALSILKKLKTLAKDSGFKIRGTSAENSSYDSENKSEDFYILGQKNNKSVVVVVTIGGHDGGDSFVIGSEDQTFGKSFFEEYQNYNIDYHGISGLSNKIIEYFNKCLI